MRKDVEEQATSRRQIKEDATQTIIEFGEVDAQGQFQNKKKPREVDLKMPFLFVGIGKSFGN